LNKQKNNENGITLISLIVTIVILIILLGIVELILPDDLLDKAHSAKNNTSGMITEAQKDINNIKYSLPDIVDTE